MAQGMQRGRVSGPPCQDGAGITAHILRASRLRLPLWTRWCVGWWLRIVPTPAWRVKEKFPVRFSARQNFCRLSVRTFLQRRMQLLCSNRTTLSHPLIQLCGLALVYATLAEILLVILADGACNTCFFQELRPRPVLLLPYLIAGGEQHLAMRHCRSRPVELNEPRGHARTAREPNTQEVPESLSIRSMPMAPVRKSGL